MVPRIRTQVVLVNEGAVLVCRLKILLLSTIIYVLSVSIVAIIIIIKIVEILKLDTIFSPAQSFGLIIVIIVEVRG